MLMLTTGESGMCCQRMPKSWVLWHMSDILAPRKVRQEDTKFKYSLDNIVTLPKTTVTKVNLREQAEI